MDHSVLFLYFIKSISEKPNKNNRLQCLGETDLFGDTNIALGKLDPPPPSIHKQLKFGRYSNYKPARFLHVS